MKTSLLPLGIALLGSSLGLGMAPAQELGELDASFGVAGVLKVDLPYAHDPTSLQMTVTPASAGRFLAVFLFRPSSSEPGWSLATCRLTAAGTVDMSFGSEGFTTFALSRTGALRLHSALFHPSNSSVFVAINDADDAVVVGLNETGTKRSTFATQGELPLAGVQINGLYEEVEQLLGGTTPRVGVFGSQSSAGPRRAFWYRQPTSSAASQGTQEFVPAEDLAALFSPADPAAIHAAIHCITTRADGVRLLIGSAEQVPGHPIGLFAKPVQAGASLSTAPLQLIPVPLAAGLTPRFISRDAVGELALHLDQADPGPTAARLRRSGAVDETCPLPASLFPPVADPGLQQNALLFAFTHRGSRYAQVRQQKRLDGTWQMELLRFDWTGQPDLSVNETGKMTLALPGLSAVTGALPATLQNHQHLVVHGWEPNDLGSPRLVLFKFRMDAEPIVWTHLTLGETTSELSLPPAGSGTLEITASNPDGLPSAAIRYYFRNQTGQHSDSSLVGSFPQQHDGSRGAPRPRVRQHTLFATDGERAAQRNALVIMQHPPYLSTPLIDRHKVVNGRSLSIKPFMRGAQPFQFFWTKVDPQNALPIAVNPALVENSSGSLWFNPIRKSDAGTYRFQFSNIDGVSEVFEVEVEVFNNPSLKDWSGSRLVAEGNNYEMLWFSLFTDGSEVTTRWTKNGKPYGRPKKDSSLDFQAGLAFGPIKRSDAGVYRASARNARGSLVTPPMRLTVVATPVPVQYAAAWHQARLQALVFGGQNLTHQWLRDGQVLQDSALFRGTATTRLTLIAAAPSDAGRYVFRTIGYGMQLDREIDLVVVTQAPQGTTTSLPTARVGTAYAAQLDFLHGVATLRVTGLPRGLRVDPVSGSITGIPEQSGSFTVVATAENPAGHAPTLRLNLEVSPFPAHLVGEYRKSGGFPFHPWLGAFQFQISRHGSLSGTLPFNGTRNSVRGRLTELPDQPGVYEAKLTTSKNAALLNLWAPSLKVVIAGTNLDLHLSEPGPNLLNGPFPGKFCPPRDHSPLAATYHLAGTATTGPFIFFHDDHGYARVTVDAKGRARWTGRLSDGSALSGSSQLNLDDAITMHWFTKARGSYFGLRDLTFTQPTAPALLQASGTAQWRPLESEIPQTWRGSAYTPPVFGPNFPLLLGAQPGTANLRASLRSIHYGNRALIATLTANHRAATALVTPPDLDRLSNVVFNPRTGLFSGTWIWDDSAANPPITGLPALGRQVRLPLQGLIVQLPNADSARGYGFATLPVVTTTSEGGTPRPINVKRPAALLIEAP